MQVRVTGWYQVGGDAAPEVVGLRRLTPAQTAGLCDAIRGARGDGGGSALLFELPRGFSSLGRAMARTAVGLGVVVVMLAGVAAFLAPSAAVTLVAAGVGPGALAAGIAAGAGFARDMGLQIFADGRLRREGWNGIRELDLRRFDRVTLSGRDDDGIEF